MHSDLNEIMHKCVVEWNVLRFMPSCRVAMALITSDNHWQFAVDAFCCWKEARHIQQNDITANDLMSCNFHKFFWKSLHNKEKQLSNISFSSHFFPMKIAILFFAEVFKWLRRSKRRKRHFSQSKPIEMFKDGKKN